MVNTERGSDGFSNKVIPTDALPTMKDIALEAISPRYRIINISLALGIAVLLISIFTGLHWQPFYQLPDHLGNAYPYVCVVTGLLGILWATYHLFADVKIQYAVREQDLCLQKGLVFRQLACQPILRVQHVETKRGPLTRLAGLASLHVFSAGGEYHTFEIPGLPVARAEQLRQFILNHKDVSAK
jgi:membrane protein YdbS with pleckstrin-like domain